MSYPHIILVHGAWADGSSWSKIIPLLQAKGHQVTAVQHPLTSLADDVAATARALALVNGPVLLVGHSYGGVVITNAGVDPKVVGLVYVAAFAPDEGEAVGDLGHEFAPPPGVSELRPDASGFLSMTAQGVADNFAQDLPPAEARLMHAVQTPTHGATFGAKTGQAAWKSKPNWYVVATHDRMIQPQLQRKFVEALNAQTLTLASSHVPMLSHPVEVADFIDGAARQLQGQ
ncbi:Pimeloyl-ACP methyl ester carboxylesterase [Roseateles sp. YR242]|uniref:alpha/beta fold hydrolase n=1 Tax=Roseateles sp. YR242 TaxID=1855305 RepID=UPI0008CC501C|nr:alpha/beta hydrolase [Roseateles sp. YR242]SEK93499.1 Pimeloyl-ACP methyl ester carboxylesterase [Roseateles sp. YR242]